jgi:hypothetical protein
MGMNRSGTSAATHVLNLLGCDLPRHDRVPSFGDELGHRQTSPAVSLNDQMLRSAGTKWDSTLGVHPSWFRSITAEHYIERVRALVSFEFNNSSFFVIDDPRLSLVFPVWRIALEQLNIEPKVLVVFRHPLEVAASLLRPATVVRPNSVLKVRKVILLWLRYFLVAEAATMAVCRSFLSYESLINDWKPEFNRISAQLDITWPNCISTDQSYISEFLNKSQKRNAVSPYPIEFDLPSEVHAIYERLLSAVTEPVYCSDKRLDRITFAYKKSLELTLSYIEALEMKLDFCEAEVRELKLGVEHTEAIKNQLAASEARARDLHHEIAAVYCEKANWRSEAARLRDLEAVNSAMKYTLSEVNLRLTRANASLSELAQVNASQEVRLRRASLSYKLTAPFREIRRFWLRQANGLYNALHDVRSRKSSVSYRLTAPLREIRRFWRRQRSGRRAKSA